MTLEGRRKSCGIPHHPQHDKTLVSRAKWRGIFDLLAISSGNKSARFGQAKGYRSRSWQQSVSESDGMLDATSSPESKQEFVSSRIQNCCFSLGR